MDQEALSGATRGVVENLSQWSLALILIFTAAGGAFGGVADLLARLRLKKNSFYLIDEAISGWNFILSMLIQCVMGICGAAAIVFVFASTTWFPREDSTQSRLWLLTLSVVAGFGARRFLPIVTRRLERQIQELEEKIEDERKELRDTEQRSMIRDTVARALVLLGRDSKATPTEMNASLMELRELLRTQPTERGATIVAARILRKLNELNEAVGLLTAFIYAKNKAGEKDVDYADVLYQRACYRCLLWSASGEAELKLEGLRDLEEAVRYNTQNGQAAREDEDFKPWWTDSGFRQTTSEAA